MTRSAARTRHKVGSPEERLALLERVGRELAAGLDLVGVSRRALALGVHAVGAEIGSLMVLDERQRLALALLFQEGRFRRVDMEQTRKIMQNGLARWVIEHGETARIADVTTDPCWLPAPVGSGESEMRSVLCAPLRIPRRLVGILTCAHRQRDYFAAEDVRVLDFIADQAAVALENARLFAAEEQRRHLADTLVEITRTLAATLDLDKLLALILENLGRVVPCDSSSVFLLQDDRLVIRAWRGFENEDLIRGLSFPVESGQILSRVVTSREVILCADVQRERNWQNVPGLVPTRGWIGAPLVARGEVVGALTVDSPMADAYDEQDAQVVSAFADHAAIAVSNARLWQQVQRRLEEVVFLYRTGQVLTASLDVDEVLRSLMVSVRDYFHLEAASVSLIEEDSDDLVFRVAVGEAADQIVGIRLKRGQGVAGWVAQTGQPALVPVARQDPRFYDGVDKATGFRTGTLIAVPIRLGDAVIGVVEAINPRIGQPDQDDLRLLQSVSALAASALQNAHHFTRARQAEQRYASLFENSADPILITDAASLITDVNLKMCELLGYQKEALVGREIATLFRDPEATRARVQQVADGESTFYNVEAVTCTGATIPFEVHANRIQHGANYSIQWVCHDMTERLALDEARQNLTHMIIHDLRNPLSSITSSLELIRMALVDKMVSIPVEQILGVAQRSGEKLYLLIDSILDLARLGEGQTQPAYKTLDIADLIREVVEQEQPQLTAYSLHLRLAIAEGLPKVEGDPALLQRVLLNLVDNALKFCPPDGEIRVEALLSDPQTIRISVADNGPGIPPEYLERIFDRFVRVPGQTVRGTGIGLAFCKLAVEAHGGRIWAESTLGHGATFRFTLPVVRKEQP